MSDLVAGLSTINIRPDATGNISVWLFGAGYKSIAGAPTCAAGDREHGTLLSMVGNGANATVTTFPVTANTPQVISLTQPLFAGAQICAFENTATDGTDSPTGFSEFKPVNYFAAGEDYGRFGLSFVGGAVITNQEQSTNSSTASQYIDVTMNYTFIRGFFKVPDQACPAYHPGCLKYLRGGPGLQGFVDVRSSTVPVTSINNVVQAQQGSAPVSITQSLNALSSQQSARILTGLYAPFRLTHWYSKTNWLTLAPLAIGGFDTLLNPTAPSSPPATGTTLNTTTANFSSVYGYIAAGGELGWKVFAASTDEAPRDMGWLSATLGRYSSLPSYVCSAPANASATPTKGYFFKDNANPTTACFVDPMPPSPATATSWHVYASRKLIPRLDLAGQLALPNLPVILGMDANLGQYWLGANKHEHIDTLNKAGNDVRIFIGLKLDITHLLTKIGASTSQ